MGLRRLAGVSKINITYGSRSVKAEIVVRSGAWLEPEQIFGQVRAVGYTVRRDSIRMTLTGTLSRTDDGQLQLSVPNAGGPSPRVFTVVEKDRPVTETGPVEIAVLWTNATTLQKAR